MASKAVVIIGPNGTGKSRLLKSQLEKHLTESVSKNILSFFSATLQPFDAITVQQILNEVFMQADWTQTQKEDFWEKVGKTYEEFELPDRLLPEKFVKLSEGEKKMLLMAIYLTLNPDILVLDEHESFLSNHWRDILTDRLIAYLKQDGKLLLMTTHNRELIEHFSFLKDNLEIIHFTGKVTSMTSTGFKEETRKELDATEKSVKIDVNFKFIES